MKGQSKFRVLREKKVHLHTFASYYHIKPAYLKGMPWLGTTKLLYVYILIHSPTPPILSPFTLLCFTLSFVTVRYTSCEFLCIIIEDNAAMFFKLWCAKHFLWPHLCLSPLFFCLLLLSRTMRSWLSFFSFLSVSLTALTELSDMYDIWTYVCVLCLRTHLWNAYTPFTAYDRMWRTAS